MFTPARVVHPHALVSSVILEALRSRMNESSTDYVNNHPEAFTEAYWDIQNIRMYGAYGKH